MKRVIWIAAVIALAGCGMRIDEQAVFRPQAHAAPAQTVEDLSRWPEADLHADFADARVRHGFIGEGDTRIAYTLVTRAGAHRPLIVHCGGNAADRYNSGVGYTRKGLPYGDVLLFDYPGYGDSPDVPNAATITDMARRVSAFAAELAGERALVFWGHSLGGFVCGRMAGATPSADGVVLEATARRVSEVAAAWTPWYAGPFVNIAIADSLASYDTAHALGDFAGPVLVLGARRDRSLPVRLSRSLAAALEAEGAAVAYIEFANARHNEISRQPEFAPAVSAYFERLQGHHD